MNPPGFLTWAIGIAANHILNRVDTFSVMPEARDAPHQCANDAAKPSANSARRDQVIFE